jgi:hypothetical protein
MIFTSRLFYKENAVRDLQLQAVRQRCVRLLVLRFLCLRKCGRFHEPKAKQCDQATASPEQSACTGSHSESLQHECKREESGCTRIKMWCDWVQSYAWDKDANPWDKLISITRLRIYIYIHTHTHTHTHKTLIPQVYGADSLFCRKMDFMTSAKNSLSAVVNFAEMHWLLGIK